MNWIRDGPRLSNKEADMDEKTYVMRAEYEEYKRAQKAEDDRQNARLHELDESQKQITDLVIEIRSLTQSVENLSKNQQSFSERLGKMEEEPAKNWSTLKTAVITAIAGGIAGWLIGVLATFAQ